MAVCYKFLMTPILLASLVGCASFEDIFDDYEIDDVSDSLEDRFYGYDFDDIDSFGDIKDLTDDDDFRDRLKGVWEDTRD